MTKQQYERISAPFRAPRRQMLLNAANRALTVAVYAFYIGLCGLWLIGRDARLLPLLLIPGVPFVLVSQFRKWHDAPRPYEALDIDPLIAKDTRGKSFPSRHVFSVFVIAVAASLLSPVATAALCLAGLVMAYIRVVGGVHFPRDVIAGALIGVISGAIGLAIWRGLVPA